MAKDDGSDLDDGGTFVEKEWIGVDKKFSNSLPSLVQQAMCIQCKVIPNTFMSMASLPGNDVKVKDFVDWKLPRISSEIISTKAELWFSSETPSINTNLLLSRPVPSKDFVERLREELGQAWLDGAKSVVDQRFNDGTDRIPLWIIQFWTRVGEIHDCQTTWKKAIQWLDLEERRQKGETTAIDAIKQAQDQLRAIGWNMKMSHCRGMTSTYHLSRFLGTLWLSDDHISMMVEELVQDLGADENSDVKLAGIAFTVEIDNISTKLALSDSARRKTLIAKYENQVKNGRLEKLYFPVHVTTNHWIGGEIHFKKKTIAFGNSLKATGNGTGAPSKFVDNLQTWLKSAFGRRFKIRGNTLPHALQDDSFSCGIITINTLEHALLNRPLWENKAAVEERLRWFIRLAKALKGKGTQTAKAPLDNPEDASSILPAKSRERFTLADLLNPIPQSDKPPMNHDYDSDSTISTSTAAADNTSRKSANGNPVEGEYFDPPFGTESDWQSFATSVPSSRLSSPALDDVGDDKMDTESDFMFPYTSSEQPPSGSMTGAKFRTLKRERSEESSDYDGDSSGSEASAEIKRQHARKYVKAGEGTSRAAAHSRKQRAALSGGTFKVDECRLEKWKKKVLDLDPEAGFSDANIRQVRHSVCGKVILMKDPYDVGRFKDHKNSCVQTGKAPSLLKMGWLKVTKKEKKKKESVYTDVNVDDEEQNLPTEPCPGLTEVNDLRIGRYLKRTGALGGGGRSLAVVAKEMFKRLFSKLTKETQKKKVVDTQMHEWKWRNDHNNRRVYSTRCEKIVDSRKKIPDDKNYKHVPRRWRNALLGEIYARNIGVKELIENEEARTSPFVRYAKGALKGDYNNEVFNGLLQAMVTKADKDERGVGMQNFTYAPAWEEMCHIARIHSPKAYNAWREYFPMPDPRNLRKQEARQPRFPMNICDRTFELVAEHLKTLNYDGPVGLSCDDTKLFATYRLYWDADENSYFLIGGTDGPIRVADADNVKQAIADAKAQKATKVRLWCLTIPVPKIAPIIVAALPIPNSLDVPTLLDLHMKVLDGLIDKGVSIVSYACDGTETERAVQKRFLEKTLKREFRIKSPRPGCGDMVVVFGIYRGQAICIIQDSKHALKTMRNNLFSGARFLIFGNFVAIYQHILEIALGDGTPLHKRDVTKVDRQDDNAAVRLFSSETLKYLASHHPEHVGEIVYLFVFGELVDAYQNRKISHTERIKMVLRARYFLDSWEAYLDKCGYRKDRYFISREANDILRILIDGFIALVIIHRDLPIPTPLLPWLHSSEACEHVFGESRMVVKDFTFLDFIYMIPKLRIKLHQAALRGKASNGKARAAGYSHSYFDHEGLDLVVLSTFPSNAEIDLIADSAAQEADSLIAFLGISSALLHRRGPAAQPWLPSIRSWMDDGMDELDLEDSDSELDDSEMGEAEELQQILDNEESSPITRSERIDRKCLNLTSAALALAAEENVVVQKFATVDDEELEQVVSDEYVQVQALSTLRETRIRDIQIPDTSSRPLGHGAIQSTDLDFDMLVKMRRDHETKQAVTGVRTRHTKISNMRAQVVQELHSALKEAQDEAAAGTGLERQARWRAAAPGGREGVINGVRLPDPAAGNSANAVTTAAAASKKAAAHRKRVLLSAKVPNHLELVDARITVFRPFQLNDYGFVITEHGVMLAQVIAFYSKTGGKNGKHAAITESSNISAVSYMGLQLFQHSFGRQFRSVSDATAIFQTKQYSMLPSYHFLCLIDTKLGPGSQTSVEVAQNDMDRFRALQNGEAALHAAMKSFRKRGSGGDAYEDDD